MHPVGVWYDPIVLYGLVTSARCILCFISVFCPDVRYISYGLFDICDIVASPFESHSQEIKYQKHFVRARYPPVAFSFFFQSPVLFVLFL